MNTGNRTSESYFLLVFSIYKNSGGQCCLRYFIIFYLLNFPVVYKVFPMFSASSATMLVSSTNCCTDSCSGRFVMMS